MPIERFEQLEVWQKARRIRAARVSPQRSFPSDERFGLVSQIRRAAVSVPANIAEGFKRRGLKDKVHFYNISQGSLEEVRYYLRLALDLNYSPREQNLNPLLDQVSRMLHGLIVSIDKR